MNLAFKEVFKIFDITSDFFSVFIFVLSILFLLFSVRLYKINNFTYVIATILFIYFSLSSFNSIDPNYGLQKVFLGIVLPLFIFNLFLNINWTKKIVYNSFIVTTLILCIVAIIYKIKAGFWIREVNFGVLGPIPFGWINGFCCIILLMFEKKSFKDYLIIFFFFLMILWTGSKGPIISLLVIILLNYKKIIGNKFSSKFFTLIIIVSLYLLMKNFVDDIRSLKGIVEFIEDPAGYSEGQGQGSIGARSELFDLAKNIFKNNILFGQGFGSFADDLSIEFKYPHNIYIECLAETGLLGFILLMSFVFINKFSEMGYASLFILICLIFSGDISYIRYAIFPLLINTYFIKNNISYN